MEHNAVADPGITVEGADPLGAPTSDTDAFRQKHMFTGKQKSWVPLGGGALVAPPDPSM